MREMLSQLTLSDVGSYASVISLILTIAVLFGVRRIRTMYLLTARLPELTKRLQSHCSTLSSCLNDFSNFRSRAVEELAAMEATLHSLSSKLDGRHRTNVRQTLRSAKSIVSAGLTEQRLRTFYIELIRVNEHLKDAQRDLKWER